MNTGTHEYAHLVFDNLIMLKPKTCNPILISISSEGVVLF